jgi:hypothetical protein
MQIYKFLFSISLINEKIYFNNILLIDISSNEKINEYDFQINKLCCDQ